jgi:hypothetical protein
MNRGEQERERDTPELMDEMKEPQMGSKMAEEEKKRSRKEENEKKRR